ncbi:MAG: DUF2807 domain-containing protein [Bacteroidales bacterium]|nr:DUF2807 domain-containing protein [Bacteroidales bacterium]
MNKTITLISTLLLILPAITSCASSVDRHGTISVDKSFDQIVVANNIKVTYTPGAGTSYTIEASDKAKSCLDMIVKGSVLTIKADGLNNETIRINLTSPAIKSYTGMNNAEIRITGALDMARLDVNVYNNSIISFDRNIKADKTDISAYNNGTVSMRDLSAGDITATAYNNAQIDLDGSATSIIYSAYNNAEINASGFKAAHGTANASNNAEINANVARLDSQTTNLGRISNAR